MVVDLTRRISFVPSFLQGSETLFIGQGTDIAFVDFSQLKGPRSGFLRTGPRSR